VTDDHSLESKRQLVLEILEGRITEETDPGLFHRDEDWLFHRLWYLSVHDGAWLDEHLADERYSPKARALLRERMPKF